jgi:hypothetical protein
MEKEKTKRERDSRPGAHLKVNETVVTVSAAAVTMGGK